MAFSGSGTYNLPAGQPVVTGTTISSSTHNTLASDLATALSTAILKDGQQAVTANIPFGGFKLTNVGAATARTDAASLATIQDGAGVYVATVGGTADAITLTPSPVVTAYAAGQRFLFIASGVNTGAVTVNVSGLGVKAVTKDGATALVAGDIQSGALVSITYDGTRFQVMSLGAASTFARTLLDDADAAATRTTLGLVAGGAGDIWVEKAGDTMTGNLTIGKVTPDFVQDALAGSNARHLFQQAGVQKWNMFNEGSGDFVINRGASGSELEVLRLSQASGNASFAGNVASDGLLDLSAATAGRIKFPGTQNPDPDGNTLDDYEEGTWTPSVGGTATYIIQTAKYTKIGRTLHLTDGKLEINVIGTGSTVTISGCPFTFSGPNHIGVARSVNCATAITEVHGVTTETGTTISLFSRTAAAASDSNANAIFGTATTIQFSGICTV